MNRELWELEIGEGKRIKLIRGDITEERVDAIVNAANSHLQHGGGVAGAISRKGGPEIQRESNEIGFVPVGQAAITGGGKLPAKHVIHTVGPRWGEGDEENKLRSAVENSLRLAEENNFQSVSMPAISSGIFGFPKDRCAEIILQTTRDYLRNHLQGSLKEVRICVYDQPTVSVFEQIVRETF